MHYSALMTVLQKKIGALTKAAIERCCERIEKAKSAVKNGNNKKNGKTEYATLPSFKRKYL